MAGELTVAPWTGKNVALVNFAPFTCAELDAPNCDISTVAVKQATGATEVIGVVYDRSKLDPAGAVIKNSGVAINHLGIAKIVGSAAVTAGAYVKVANASGQVNTATQAIAGAQAGAIVGRALNTTAASGDLVLVLLMIGARY